MRGGMRRGDWYMRFVGVWYGVYEIDSSISLVCV